MAGVTHTLLKNVPYRAFTLAEDVEYGIEAGLAGYRVHYADEAHVNGEMVSDAKSADRNDNAGSTDGWRSRVQKPSRCSTQVCDARVESASTWRWTLSCRRFRTSL